MPIPINNNEEKINSLREQIEPFYEQYKEKCLAYEEAVREYNDLRTNALSNTDSRAIHEYSINSRMYSEKVKIAMNDWVVQGHKNEVEATLSRIDQLSRESG